MPLITDGRIDTGFLGRKRILVTLLNLQPEEDSEPVYLYIPKPVYNYAKRISEVTGLPLKTVLKSRPVRNLINRWSEYVAVPV